MEPCIPDFVTIESASARQKFGAFIIKCSPIMFKTLISRPLKFSRKLRRVFGRNIRLAQKAEFRATGKRLSAKDIKRQRTHP